jgi:hypothetical protein
MSSFQGYYVASKLRFLPQAQSKGYHLGGGYYLAVRCLPLNITNIYFILSEFTRCNGRRRGSIDRVYHGSPLLGHRQACMAVGVACLESMNWVRVTGSEHFSHIGGCSPDRVIWLATLFHSVIRGEIIMDTIGGSTSKVSVRRTCTCRTGGNRRTNLSLQPLELSYSSKRKPHLAYHRQLYYWYSTFLTNWPASYSSEVKSAMLRNSSWVQ